MLTETTEMKSAADMTAPKQFKGDRKNLDHMMLAVERKVIAALLPLVPSWLGTVQLTQMTLLWSMGVVIFGYLSVENLGWLLAFSACIALQHITDMLDGAVGRARNTGLIKWGFYADHLLDYIFICSVVIGYSFLLPQDYHFLVLLALVFAGGLMAHTFLDFAITNDYKISYYRIGVSELRCFVIVFNIVCVFLGKDILVKSFPYVVVGLFAALLIVVYQSQITYRIIDLKNLHKDELDNERRPL